MAAFAVRMPAPGDFDRAGRLFDPIQRKIENIIVAKRSGFRSFAIYRIERSRQRERNPPLGEAAVRTQAVSRQ